MRHRCLMLLGAAASALAASIAPPSAQDIPQAAFNELKHGGFVVMFRHGKTNPPAGAAEDKAFAGDDLAVPIALVLRREAVEPLGRRVRGLRAVDEISVSRDDDNEKREYGEKVDLSGIVTVVADFPAHCLCPACGSIKSMRL